MNVNSLKLMGMLLVCNILSLNSCAQSVGINNDDSNPNANAILDVKSTTKGFLVPRMTTSQRTTFTSSLATADQAMLVFDTDLGSFYFWNGTAWTALSASAIKLIEDADGDTKIQVEKNTDEDLIRFDVRGTEAMVIDSLGNVGIGTAAPATVLDVNMGQIPQEEVMVSQATHSTYFSSGGLTWQSFTATTTGELSNISVYINSTNALSKTVNIYEGEGTGGTLLYTSATVTSSGIGFLDIPITGGVNLVVGNQYTFELQQESVGYIAGNVYTGGTLTGVSFVDMAFTVNVVTYNEGNFQVSNSGVNIYNYTLPVKDGTANQALITDGAGIISWRSPFQTIDNFSLTNDTLYLSLLNDGVEDYAVGFSSFKSDSTKLTDADGDTKIQVEKNMDEDHIRFNVGGTEAMVIDHAGNVGIGTASPAAALDISMGLFPINQVIVSQSININRLSGSGTVWQSFTATQTAELSKISIHINNTGSLDKTLKLYEGEGTSGTLLYTSSTFSSSGVGDLDIPISGSVNLVTGNQYTFEIETESVSFASSNVYAGGRSSVSSSWDLAFSVSILSYEGGNFQVSNSGVKVYNYTLPASDGAVNQVLMTNGAGTVSWSNPFGSITSNIELSGNWLSNDGDNEGIFVATDGNVGIGTNTTSYLLQVGTSGDGSEARANAWNTFSDRRWKTNFKRIDNPLGKLSIINGYYYHWKDAKDSSLQVGVIAQEIETVLPEIVSTDRNGYKSVDYSKLTALLIEVNKQQQQEIDELKTKLSEMEKLKAEVAAIKVLLIQAEHTNKKAEETASRKP